MSDGVGQDVAQVEMSLHTAMIIPRQGDRGDADSPAVSLGLSGVVEVVVDLGMVLE